MNEVVHDCPRRGEQVTLCCGKSPFELPFDDRMTVDQDLVTCNRDGSERGRRAGGEQHG